MGVYVGDINIPYVSEFSVNNADKPIEIIKHLGNVVPHVAEFQTDVLNATLSGTLFQASGDLRDVDQYVEDLTALVDRWGWFNYIHNYQNRSGWLILSSGDPTTKSADSILLREYSISGRFMPKSKYQSRMHTAPVILSNPWSHVLGTDDCDNYVAIPIGATYSGGDGSTITRSSEDGTITLVLATTDNDIYFDLSADEAEVGECKIFDMMSENILNNDDFEDWSSGTSSAPDGWALVGTGTIARSTTKKVGTYAAESIATGGTYYYLQQTISSYAKYKGVTITFGEWVKCATAGKISIRIFDGVSSSYSSSNATTDWEFLMVTKTLSASATTIICGNRLTVGYTAYLDGAILLEDSEVPETPVLDTYGVRVYGRDREFTGSMVIENGLYRIMLNPSTDHITLYYWDGSEYVHMSAFSAGTFTRATITGNTPDCIKVELDSDVDIELRRGHPPMIDTGTTDLVTVGLTPSDQSTTTDNYLSLGTSIYICSDENFSIVNATQNLDDGKKWIFYETVSATAEDIAHQALVDARLNRELVPR
ncbi:MAG: hypothetical protein KAS66_02725 [Candidatus Omnitrophica bacterium]|nr:hypothetical protein [Candidatus Omnitrophota bacterium]